MSTSNNNNNNNHNQNNKRRKLTQGEKDALDRALSAGLKPRATAGSKGLIVSVPGGRYRTLITSKGQLTGAGQYFYQKQNASPPNRTFDPAQEPQRVGRRETVVLRDGNTTVRTWDHIHKKWNLTRLG
ncbi:MAG: hypothetical protein AAFS07_19290, partial [Pseudomonadota bacterium]